MVNNMATVDTKSGNTKNRFLVFAAEECHEPRDFIGAFSSFEEVLSVCGSAISSMSGKKHEVIEVYDVFEEKVNRLWNGMDLSFLAACGAREPKDAPATGSWSDWKDW